MKIFNSVFTLTFIWLARIGGVRAHATHDGAHVGRADYCQRSEATRAPSMAFIMFAFVDEI